VKPGTDGTNFPRPTACDIGSGPDNRFFPGTGLAAAGLTVAGCELGSTVFAGVRLALLYSADELVGGGGGSGLLACDEPPPPRGWNRKGKEAPGATRPTLSTSRKSSAYLSMRSAFRELSSGAVARPPLSSCVYRLILASSPACSWGSAVLPSAVLASPVDGGGVGALVLPAFWENGIGTASSKRSARAHAGSIPSASALAAVVLGLEPNPVLERNPSSKDAR